MNLVQDVLIGIGYGIYYLKNHLLRSYILIPVGVLVEFMILYGLNQFIIQILKIKFPASVMGMLINLVILCLFSVLGKRFNYCQIILTQYLRVIQPSMNFSLKWINIFFIPSFIILPLSKPITIIEVLKIAAVFIVGWVLLMIFNVYVIQLLQILFKLNRKQKVADNNDSIELSDLPDRGSGNERDSDGSVPTQSDNDDDRDNPFTSMRDITTIDLRTIRTEPQLPVTTMPDGSNSRAFGSEITRPESSHIKSTSTPASLRVQETANSTITNTTIITSGGGNSGAVNDLHTIPRSRSSSGSGSGSKTAEYPHLSKVSEKAAIFVTTYIDWVLYGLLFISSIPLYYVRSYHLFLPFHLSITILSYFVALLIPLKWPFTKKFAHPILVSTGMILFICFISSLIYHHHPKGFLMDLKYYKTGKNYLNLFSNKLLLNNGLETNSYEDSITRYPIWPGCGDFLSSLMDISIVSLSLPMFTHRNDFIRNFWIMIPILASMALSFFIYPLVCYNIGISSKRSIGFIGRSVTLALGTPLIDSLNGSVSLMAVCTILSGIIGVLIGDTVFNLLRVNSNDFITRGVSLGINCGAIATAHLLTVDPRAASMSSLSFTIFGTVMIILASIGDIRLVIQNIAHL